jgi:hypothetical protein
LGHRTPRCAMAHRRIPGFFRTGSVGPFRNEISRCEGRPRRASTARHCRRSCAWTSSRPG